MRDAPEVPWDVPVIHDAVREHSQTHPESLALVDGEEQVTYSELQAASGWYAEQLVAQGVQPGDLVAVRVRRGSHFVAVLLGVLRCGASYAALDLTWPRARVLEVLEDLAPVLMVVDPDEEHSPAGTWQVRSGPLRALPPAAVDVQVAVTPESIATVLFTSGTTGRPKAVLTTHRAAARLFHPAGPLAFGPGTVMPQVASASWDALVLELWGMLTTGGTVVLPPQKWFLPNHLADLVASTGVNTAWLTSSLFNLFVEEDIGCFAGMRQLLIGGERLSTRHVLRFLQAHPNTALYNGYGPVETCVFATLHPIELADAEGPGGVPLGLPVPHTRVVVLDGERRCTPGEQGEIAIAGEGLSRGYLGDDALTAQRFPTVELDGLPVRVYRTGDLGHVDEGGVLHFAGRSDRQVKVRGVRVEPVELEVRASKLVGVLGCVAVPVPGKLSGHDRLALFVTSSSATPLDPRALRRTLVGGLPAHLVPDVVLQVERLPLSSNGKIDTAALLLELATPHSGR